MSDINDGSFYKEVEIDPTTLRHQVLSQWQKEELTQTFRDLKNDLID